MQHCPNCKSGRVHASRSRSAWEAWRKAITGKRPYRCSVCNWRGWAPDRGPQFSPDEIEFAFRAVAQNRPNLNEAMLARERTPQAIDLGEALQSQVVARQG